MKRLTHENGQPRLVKENLDWDSGSTQAALREHIADIFSPGFVQNSGLNGNTAPCIISPTGSNYTVKISSGVAIAPLVQEWPPANIDANDIAETGGERIVVSEADALVQWDPANATKTTNNGLGVFVSTPASSGAYGIPAFWSSVEGKYSHFWLAYLDAVSTAAPDTIASKTEAGKTLFPKHVSGYQIAVTATDAAPDASGKWLYIGNIYVPAAPNPALSGSIVDQSAQVFSDIRSSSALDLTVQYQADSNSSGIVGSAGALQLGVDNGFVGTGFVGQDQVSYSTAAIVVQLQNADAVYVGAYRGSKVTPEYTTTGSATPIPIGTLCGYVGFVSAGVHQDDDGLYSIYIDRDPVTRRFVVRKALGTVIPAEAVLVGTVLWTAAAGFSTAPADIVDKRIFGLISTADIQNGAVTDSKLSGGVNPSKLLLSNNNIIVGNPTGVGTAVPVSGAISIDNTGSTAISANTITNTMIKDNEVWPHNVQQTGDFTMNQLTTANGLITNGPLIVHHGNVQAGRVLKCQGPSGLAAWEELANPVGAPPAPIRWTAQGDLAVFPDIVSTLIDVQSTISGVYLSLGTAPQGGTVGVDIYKYTWNSSTSTYSAPVPIFSSGSSPSYAPNVKGLITVNPVNIEVTSLAVGDKLALQITSVGASPNFGKDLLVTVKFANT